MRGASFSLTKDQYSIGRADECDVSIADPTISGHHCLLIKQESENYAVQDQGSTNGTKVNDEKLEEGQLVPLKNGDILQVGGVEILYDDIQGDRMESSRTVSVINLEDTGSGDVSKTSMKNLDTKLSVKRSVSLRENRTHNMVLNCVLGLMGVIIVVLVVYMLFFSGKAPS